MHPNQNIAIVSFLLGISTASACKNAPTSTETDNSSDYGRYVEGTLMVDDREGNVALVPAKAYDLKKDNLLAPNPEYSCYVPMGAKPNQKGNLEGVALARAYSI